MFTLHIDPTSVGGLAFLQFKPTLSVVSHSASSKRQQSRPDGCHRQVLLNRPRHIQLPASFGESNDQSASVQTGATSRLCAAQPPFLSPLCDIEMDDWESAIAEVMRIGGQLLRL